MQRVKVQCLVVTLLLWVTMTTVQPRDDEQEVQEVAEKVPEEADKLNLAAGGDDTRTKEEQEVDELHQRLKGLSRKDRRRTMERLSDLFPGEEWGQTGLARPEQRSKDRGE